MEAIYLKNHSCDWHSDNAELEVYFKKYSEAYCKTMKNSNMSLGNILKSVLPEKDCLDQKEMGDFIQEMSELEKELKTKLPSSEFLNRSKPLTKAVKVVSKKSNLKGVVPQNSSRNCEKSQNSEEHNSREPKENKLENNHHEGQSPKGQHDTVLLGKYPQKTLKNLQSEEINASVSQLKHDKTKKKIKGYKTKAKNPKVSKSPLNILEFRELTKSSKYKNSVLTSRRELLSEESNKNKKKTLRAGKHFVLVFRIHEPFAKGENHKIENFKQEILVLNHQTLEELRNKIICQADFQDVRGDVSNDPDGVVKVFSRDKYKSAMFYLGNTFYVDERGDEDYSAVIRRWAHSRNINVGETRSMRDSLVGELNVRFGYPYLYMHQGCCEHLIVISDARLLTAKDSLYSEDYPLISSMPRPITLNCFLCLTKPSMWIVVGNEQLPLNVVYMCKKCFKSFNYVDGKKTGNFKAYRFFQKNLLL